MGLVLLFNNCSYSLRVGVRVFRVGGEGLGSVFTYVLAVSGLGSAWSFRGGGGGEGTCRSFKMGAVVGGCMSRDICLDVLGFAAGLRCLYLGDWYGLPFVVGWAEPESEPQLKMCYPYEVIHDLGTFLSRNNKTYALPISARPEE